MDKKSYELVKLKGETYIIEDRAIYYQPDGFQDVDIGDIVIDVFDGIIGCVSHIGDAWSFKGTLQFPENDDLHINRHCTFHCRKVLASTNSCQDGANSLKIVGKFKKDISGSTESNIKFNVKTDKNILSPCNIIITSE